MGAKKGRLMLIKKGDGASPEVFTTVTGLRDTTITINNQVVDTSNKDSAGVRELLDGKIVQSFSVTGSGVMLDDTAFNTLRDAAMAGTHHNYQITIPGASGSGGGTYQGGFAITQFSESGSYNGEMQYTITLESNGGVNASDEAVAFTDGAIS